MIYPLVRELAADGVPVAVTCRVLKIARQPYYRWLADPVTAADLDHAYRANALFDAHRDDPEFGYRFLLDEAAAAGRPMAARTAWRICSANKWWSSFGKKRGAKNCRSGPPVHDDLVERNFTADAPNMLWLMDITEHHTGDGEALPLRGQGRVLQPDRGLLDRFTDESPPRGRCPVLRRGPAPRSRRPGRRLRRPQRPRVAISLPEVRPRSERPRDGRIDGTGWCLW